MAIGIYVRISKADKKNHSVSNSIENQLIVINSYIDRTDLNKEEKINEWVDFSIVAPDNSVKNTLLYKPVDRFSIQTDSYYFNNLINFTKWNKRQELLDIAYKYMKP